MRAWAVVENGKPLKEIELPTPEPKGTEVLVEVTHCGVCHSDLHTAKNEWTNTTYPVVPGHEIVGRVSKVGSDVTKFKVGDQVGVGCWSIPAASAKAARPGWRTIARMARSSPTTAKTRSSAA